MNVRLGSLWCGFVQSPFQQYDSKGSGKTSMQRVQKKPITVKTFFADSVLFLRKAELEHGF